VSDFEDSFERLSTFVEDEMRFATSYYNDSYLKRRITSRMRRRGAESYSEYLELLGDYPDERQALLDALCINVSGFFRNPDVWEGIRGVLRTLTDECESVQVWSAGCADGREPYSVAMLAVDDPEIDEDRLVITGTDINRFALEHSRRGRYTGSRTVDLSEQLEFLADYSRYVEQNGLEFQIEDSIRDRVEFERHDLIQDEPRDGCDLVLCRNLFIYIDGEYKEPVIDTVRRSLEPGSYLVIGKAETIPHSLRDDFSVLDSQLRIYRRAVDDDRSP